MNEKLVYSFNEGSMELTKKLGTKGAALAEMTQLGLPVPFGFTITRDAKDWLEKNDPESRNLIITSIKEKIKELETVEGKTFGNPMRPLLVSVRPGASICMPNMMESIVNVGMNDAITKGLSDENENATSIYCRYCKFIKEFAALVDNIAESEFKEAEEDFEENGDGEYEKLVRSLKNIYEKESGRTFPQDPYRQLYEAVYAVMKSWKSFPSTYYRKLEGISNEEGPAVSVETMVYDDEEGFSGRGTVFSRNPVTGERHFYGEYIEKHSSETDYAKRHDITWLHGKTPELYKDLTNITGLLEKQFRDIEKIDFVIENGKLYILQASSASRTAQAAIRIAVTMRKQKMINREEAVMRVLPRHVREIMKPEIKRPIDTNSKCLIDNLLSISGTDVTGRICFTSNEAEKLRARGNNPILVRETVEKSDIKGISAAEGLIVFNERKTSHISDIVRALGKGCLIAEDREIEIDRGNDTLIIGDTVLEKGDYVSITRDGKIYKGLLETKASEITDELAAVLSWSDSHKRMKVEVDANNIADAETAMDLGAEGIGSFMTQSLFVEKNRIKEVKKLISPTSTKVECEEALKKIGTYQKGDFKKLFKIAEERPVSIRLLDLKNDFRFSVSHPEIVKMQVRAACEAAVEVRKEDGHDITLNILIPMVSFKRETFYMKRIIQKEVEQHIEEYDSRMIYHIGAMIEIPRAAIRADEIAEDVDFFTFDTDELTRLIFGFSREHGSSIPGAYMEKGILINNVFSRLDQRGVGKFIENAVKRGRNTRENMKMSVKGEHMRDYESIRFFEDLGINYISCKPDAVPVARLLAARAAIEKKHEEER